ncbi:putative multidrug resistance protein [Phragmites australis]|uniref:putative multidrug resistance protein n=1 Tax=Phragmites australis TaxID=29695 RepID=UPI002D79E895|nr:putative multidrug resistance protein [Phragmites australis]XP_062217410.1 putative multidrug resistance protein [Phragmites australis]
MSVFMHADAADVALMVLGLVGAIGDGMSTPLRLLIACRIANDLGSGPDLLQEFTSRINANVTNIVFLACASWVMAFLEGYCWARTAERQASRMRARYLRAVLRQDVEYFDLKAGSSSEVVTSVSNDSLVVQDALGEKVPNFVMNVAMFAGSYAVGFTLLWRLTLVALPSVLLLVIPGFTYSRVITGLARRIREQYARPGAIAEQAVSSVRTAYSFVAERSTMARFSAALEKSARLGIKQGLTKGIALGSNGIVFAIYAFNIWYGSRLVMYHGYPGGTVFMVSSLIIIGGVSLGSALSNVKYFSEATAAAERILEMIQRVPKIDSESDAGDELTSVAGAVEFKNVEFCYPSRKESPVFACFSLRVPAGRTVALVGGSGSGKSTVIALLERFYDPSAGEVVLDGVDIRRLRLKWLRAQMGLVGQEPAMFATSVRENILFGKENATAEEVIAAAKAANAHNFISQLPQGYDTQVGERGVQMSGGQKQRIAIARAILKSPKILLLDEATSALDSASERVVQEALDVASMGRTAIVVAHRLSTIRNADTIAVMQSGAVQEQGSHSELIARNGLYSSLVHLQQTCRGPIEGNEVIGETCRASPTVGQCSSNTTSKMCSSVSRSSPARSMGDAGDGDGAVEPKPPAVPSFRRLLLLNAPEWKHALVGSFSAFLSGAIQPVYAYGMGSMFSVYYLTDHEEIKDKTRMYALVFLALVVLSFLLSIGQHYSFGAMGEYLTKRVRERMLEKILTFEIEWFDHGDNSSGAICSRLAKDANIVRSLVGDRVALVIQTVSVVFIACTMGIAIAWRLALVTIAMQPLIVACFYARRVLLKSMSMKSIQAQAETSKLAADAVSNLRTITAFSSQDRILRLFGQAQDGPRKESIRQSWFAGFGLGTSVSVMVFSWALSFWYGGKLMAERRITAEAVFQTTMILVITGRVIADACSMTADLAKGADAVASVFAILDRETKIDPDSPEGYKPEKLTGEVEIIGVDFAYPSRPDVIIFKGFSLSIMPGKSTALVGHSGSGKSTIIGLIERFYDPLRGVVSIDGRDMKTYNLRALRRQIGLVSQEPTLFSGTIRENIMYGLETASAAEVEDAARSANAHDFIGGLKDGYDTWCGDRGVQLSGGQKQRVAIARAILKNPAILLLDEATSALDSQSEKAVQEALDRVMVGRTSVVVAHRLSTIQSCDMIAVLERGAVVEKGTHASLMAKGPSGTYFGLVSLQQGGNQH